MNGGSLSRVTSAPLIAPASSPAATPISRARKPGTPLFAARFAMISEERMAMAPTDKSMPAVKMTKRLPDRESRDHRDLLQDDADGGRLDEARIDDRKGDH